MPLLGTRGAASARGFGFTGGSSLPAIGAAYQGGYFAGQISTSGNGVATHNLVVSPKSSGNNSSKQFKTSNTQDAGATSVIDGPSNSSSMNDVNHPAAQFCEGLSIGGYSDWYLPAKLELEVCYYNLKPSTSSNITDYGANTYAVPSRANNYTSSIPGQTIATDFKDTGSQYFDFSPFSILYWSSTQVSNNTNAFLQRFSFGNLGEAFKTDSFYVRAIRRVAV